MGIEVPKALVFYDNNTPNDLYAQVFANELFGFVRSIKLNNDILFCGIDVARCLGYARPDKVIQEKVNNCNKVWINKSILDKISDPPKLGVSEMPYNNNGMNFITIGGVFELIMKSKLPSARQFQLWVTNEVLPIMYNIGFTNSMSILRQENERLKQEIDVYKNLHNPNKALFDLLVNTGKIQIGEKY